METQSLISMQSHLTGLSRKSSVSLLNLDSIISNADSKMPKDRGLLANAKRR